MSRIFSVARASAAVGAASVASRILGFVRDVLIAQVLGAGAIADAFLVAFRIPNVVRRVLGEGGLNAGFVPLLGAITAQQGPEAARQYAGRAISNVAFFLVIITALAQIAAGPLVLLVASGFADEQDKFALTVLYTQFALPFVAFTSLASLIAAYLNAQRHFIAAAAAPALVNGLLIIALLAAGQAEANPETGLWLAAVVSLSGLMHLVIVAWAMLRMPDRPPLRLPRFDGAVGHLLRFALPALVASSMTQVILLAATMIASSEPSAVSWLYYADRVFQLPLSFIGVAAGVVLLPEFVARTRNQDPQIASTLATFLNGAVALALPAAAGLIALGSTITSILFERGAFTIKDSDATSALLMALALGLPAAAASKILIQPFFARQQLMQPMLAGALGVLATFTSASLFAHSAGDTVEIVSFVSMLPVQISTLGLATSAGLWTQALMLALMTRSDVQWTWALGARLIRLSLAAFIMGLVVATFDMLAAPWLAPDQPIALRGIILTALCALGTLVYVKIVSMLGEIATIMPWKNG
ncbi:murein biosynthesis integral membrane protein MurJ [Pseudochelatococcus sp. G4_1912]|uniref:murein biosynthesis integral membrane protein MurJ n=1 Tax=Pseudochelatococcus sp. G4_1912 TaxID=3114288 RepID=UPI0039C6FFD2